MHDHRFTAVDSSDEDLEFELSDPEPDAYDNNSHGARRPGRIELASLNN